MTTWLPFADFEETAAALSNNHLTRQVCVNRLLLRRITGKNVMGTREETRWLPTVMQWAGYPNALYRYCLTIAVEAMGRGLEGYDEIEYLGREMMHIKCEHEEPDPPWLGFAPYHQSHANCLRGGNGNDIGWYIQHLPGAVRDAYVLWPVTQYGCWRKGIYRPDGSIYPTFETFVGTLEGYVQVTKYRLRDLATVRQCTCCHYWCNPEDLDTIGECQFCRSCAEERQVADELRGMDDDECTKAAREMDLVVQTRVRLMREGSLSTDLENNSVLALT